MTAPIHRRRSGETPGNEGGGNRRAAQKWTLAMTVVPLKPTTKVFGEMSPETAHYVNKFIAHNAHHHGDHGKRGPRASPAPAADWYSQGKPACSCAVNVPAVRRWFPRGARTIPAAWAPAAVGHASTGQSDERRERSLGLTTPRASRSPLYCLSNT